MSYSPLLYSEVELPIGSGIGIPITPLVRSPEGSGDVRALVEGTLEGVSVYADVLSFSALKVTLQLYEREAVVGNDGERRMGEMIVIDERGVESIYEKHVSFVSCLFGESVEEGGPWIWTEHRARGYWSLPPGKFRWRGGERVGENAGMELYALLLVEIPGGAGNVNTGWLKKVITGYYWK